MNAFCRSVADATRGTEIGPPDPEMHMVKEHLVITMADIIKASMMTQDCLNPTSRRCFVGVQTPLSKS